MVDGVCVRLMRCWSVMVSAVVSRRRDAVNDSGACGVPVAESVLAPPGPIPNPVVTQYSAGEYCSGDAVGGEAAAGTSQVLESRYSHTPPCRGVEQWQLVGLITQRSEVRILPPLPHRTIAGFCHRSFFAFNPLTSIACNNRRSQRPTSPV